MTAPRTDRRPALRATRARPGSAAPARRGHRLGFALALAVVAACAGPQRTSDGAPTAPGEAPAAQGAPDGEATLHASPRAADPRTPIERRRDAACDQLGPRITACAVEDARAKLAAGKIDQRQFDTDTAPSVQRKHTEEFITACQRPTYSSRQVRVLEVCLREETRCGPLLDCLAHLQDRLPLDHRRD